MLSRKTNGKLEVYLDLIVFLLIQIYSSNRSYRTQPLNIASTGRAKTHTPVMRHVNYYFEMVIIAFDDHDRPSICRRKRQIWRGGQNSQEKQVLIPEVESSQSPFLLQSFKS